MKEGLRGGLLTVLSDGDLQRIHQATLAILAEPGVRTDSDLILDTFARAGARVDREARGIRLEAAMVEEAVRLAPRAFVFHGREAAMDLLLEQPRTYFGLGGSAVPFFWDAGKKALRSPTSADMVAATRVGHALPNVDFVMSLAAAGEAPPEQHYFHEYAAIFANTTKPVIYSAPGRAYAARFLEMAAEASGGERALRERPSVMLFAQSTSPLQLNAYCEGIAEFAAAGAPVLVSPGPMMGATSPATLAGTLVQGNAEALAGIVFAQLLKPGTPVVYGPHTPVMDMATTRCTYAGTEQSLARAAMNQLARFYGLPSFGVGAGVDSKAVDAQSGAEALQGILLNALSGQTLTQTMGTMAGGTFGCLEMLVICDELVAMAKRILRGVRVDEETLAVEEIRAGAKSGHYLSTDHTARLFRSEFFLPRLFDRLSVQEWEMQGAPTAYARARERVREILGG
jgi:trimethylamine--corrinoid protein Co-methyltransferase